MHSCMLFYITLCIIIVKPKDKVSNRDELSLCGYVCKFAACAMQSYVHVPYLSV